MAVGDIVPVPGTLTSTIPGLTMIENVLQRALTGLTPPAGLFEQAPQPPPTTAAQRQPR